MMKSNEKTLLGFQIFSDALLAIVFWLLSYFIRFKLFPGAQEGLDSLFIKASFLVSALTVYFFRREGLYRSYRLNSRWQELVGTAHGNLLAVVSFVVVVYFIAPERLSRAVILGYFAVSTIGFIVYRFAVRSALVIIRQRGYNLRHIFLVGHGRAIERYVQNVLRSPGSGVRFLAWADSNGLAEKYGIPEYSDNLSRYVREVHPDAIVASYEGEFTGTLHVRMKELHNDVVPIIVLPDLTYSIVGFQTEKMAGVPALILNQPNFSTTNIVLKRIFDISVAGMGLIAISPLLLFLAIGVRLSSKGPIFFGQERVGLDGHRFKMWKFRTMKVGSHEANGVPGWTQKDDPRRTKFGSFLRSTSLDELPQLWNVVVGDMSLVGPRPEQPYYVEKFRDEIPAYMLRHKMKAGITGWAQVNGWRGDTSLVKRIECDLYYIRNWSIWLDIKILILTVWKGLINKNAY